MKTAKLSLILLIAAITISAPISVGFAASVGNPVSSGSYGTPVYSGSSGSPVYAGSTGAAVVSVSGSTGTAVSTGSTGTPVYTSTGSTGTAVSTGSTGIAVSTGSTGTPIQTATGSTGSPVTIVAGSTGAPVYAGSTGTVVSTGSTGSPVQTVTGSTGSPVVTATGSTGSPVITSTGSTGTPVYTNTGSTGTPTTPVLTGSVGTPIAPCPVGYTKVGSVCQPTVINCPTGYTWSGSVCLPPVVQTIYQCNDGFDNDGDGLVDMNDPGCGYSTDSSEINTTYYNPPITCSSGYYLSGNTCYPYQTGGPNYQYPNYYNYNYNNTNCGYGYYMSGGTCYPNNYQTGGQNYYNYSTPTYYTPPTVISQPPVVISQPVAPTETRYTPAVSTTQTIVRNVTTQTPVSNVVFRPSTALEIRNIRVYNSADNSTIVAWDTSLPTSGQVVFGFTSKPANTPYDFTTGWQNDQVTHREMSLGQLELNRVYYIRINADTPDGALANSPEMTFIPLPGGKVQVQSAGGADITGTASALSIFGLELSGKVLVALLLILLVVILAIMAIRRRGTTYNN